MFQKIDKTTLKQLIIKDLIAKDFMKHNFEFDFRKNKYSFLAEAINEHPIRISQWITGNYQGIPGDKLKKIAQYFNVNENDLIISKEVENEHSN